MNETLPAGSPHSYDFFVEGSRFNFEKKKSHLLARCAQIIRRLFSHRDYNLSKVSATIYSSCLKTSQPSTLSPCLAYELSCLAKKKSISLSTEKIQKLIPVLLKDCNEKSLIQNFGKELPPTKALEKLRNAVKPNTELGASIEKLINKLSVIRKWESLGFDSSLVATDFESIQFLVKERLIYTIAGLQNTSSAGHDQLKVVDGKLQILVQGKFTPVASLIDRFYYQAFQYEEKSTGKPWNYLLPQGLVQVDRCTSEKLMPITRLTPDEMKALLAHASSFEGLSFTKEDPPKCVLQIVGKKLPDILETPILDGVRSVVGGHQAFRIIDEDGQVYSSGTAATSWEGFSRSDKKNMLVTINGMPGITDFDEFRPHRGRNVTSVPMTKATYEKIMRELNLMRNRGIRFNFTSQNCTRLVTYVLELAGVKIDHRFSYYKIAYNMLPDISHLPGLEWIIRKIVLCSHAISKKTLLPSIEETTRVIGMSIRTALTPLRYICNALLNAISIGLGGKRGTTPPPDLYGTHPGDGLSAFTSNIAPQQNIFSDQSNFAYVPGAVLEWQSVQKSNLVYNYTQPSMNVLPQGGTRAKKSERKATRLQQPYLRQQRLEELSKIRKRVLSKIFGKP